MNAIFSLLAVLVLVAVSGIGVESLGLKSLFGIIIPYLAIVIFLAGFIIRVLKWAKSPVPFRIPTTCGQQKTLPWIKQNKLDNPYTGWAVIGRMLLEVLFFRSLFRNTKQELKEGPKLVYGSNKYLWLGGLVFHWSFLIIFIRHFRFFSDPVPWGINLLEKIDSFFQIGLPIVYLTDAAVLAAVTYLLFRRLMDSKLRYISLASDYFPLFLIMGIALTGVWMRYFQKVDIISVKTLSLGLFTFHPVIPEGISFWFFVHIFLVSVLIAYFPMSKLMHMGGVFLSPTRNLANNSRAKRHINPWNPTVKLHTYEEWEDEFREKMREAGMPLEKE